MRSAFAVRADRIIVVGCEFSKFANTTIGREWERESEGERVREWKSDDSGGVQNATRETVHERRSGVSARIPSASPLADQMQTVFQVNNALQLLFRTYWEFFIQLIV